MEHWENSPIEDDVLIFLCDVDVAFDSAFLERCRRNAQPKRIQYILVYYLMQELISFRYTVGQAYFPIVFSQYNPNVTRRYTRHRDDSQVPTLHKDTGFWRDFGFGMVCQFLKNIRLIIITLILFVIFLRCVPTGNNNQKDE